MKKVTLFIFLIAILLVTGCVNKQALPNEKNTNDENVIEDVSESTISMLDFFLSDGSKAHYKGDGNEFAELDIEVAHVYDNYIIVHENNGGSYMRYTYKIETDKIMILEETMVDFDQRIHTLKEIEALQPIGVYLKKPFKEGITFGDWTIVQTGAIVETPYKTFDNALVIEMAEDDFVNRKYFVQGFGEVKREFVMATDDEDFVVTSTLEFIDQ